MNISLGGSPQRCIVEIDGELDRDTLTENFFEGLSSDSRSTIEQAEEVAFDLTKVVRADTAGLAWLLNSIRDIRALNKTVSVKNIPKKLVDLAGLSNTSQLLTQGN